MVGDVVATMYITFFIRYISVDVHIIIWIGFSLNAIVAIMGFFLIESPAWLLSSGDKAGAIKALKFVAKINGVENYELEDLKEEKFETGEAGSDDKK
jgi:hypothetical protein